MGKVPSYSEQLLHWLWKNRFLKNRQLRTADGKRVLVHHPGYSNSSDGPDFTNARITIGDLKWHGDIEIHWTAGDWQKHGHHTDQNYCQVILHVVFNDVNPAKVQCSDGSLPPMLLMQPFLPEPLQYFFRQYRRADGLACAGNLSDVPEPVLAKQFEHTHEKYFEQKVDDLLAFYDPVLPLSKAWIHMLSIGLFDALGISHNRNPMRKLARLLLTQNDHPSKTALAEMALQKAGIEPRNPQVPFNWKRKGSRPANRPQTRIRQGSQMLYHLRKTPFKQWLKADIKQSFNRLCAQIDTEPDMGRQQSGVLFGTVWLPAFYLLGELTGTEKLQSDARREWSVHRTTLPGSITKHFRKAGVPSGVYDQKLGAVHQYRTYCKPQQCQLCRVFNHIISA